jgi:hypothetical protein
MQIDTIDVVSVDPKNGQAELITTISADQYNMPELDLKKLIIAKINACMRYAQSGQLYNEYPASKELIVTIKLISEVKMEDKFDTFLSELEIAVGKKAMKFEYTLFNA